jgi:hypothetical protein
MIPVGEMFKNLVSGVRVTELRSEVGVPSETWHGSSM